MKKITILSLFALMLFIVYGCGGGGLGLPGGSWDSGDGTTPASTTTKNIEINGSFTAPAVPAPAGGPSFAADISSGRYSLSIVDRDNPAREAGTMSASGNTFNAVIKASAVNMHAMIVLTDKQSQRVLYRNLLGKVPKFSEIPSTVNKVVINGIAINEISTARALFAIEKGLSDVAITTVSTSEVQSGGVVTKDYTGIKTDFDAAAENMAGGSANVTQLANAVQSVAAVLASTSINESTKNIIAIDQIENATEMLTSFLNSLKNASAQQLIQANGLTQSVKIGDTSINSSTSQTAVNSAVSGVIPIAPAAVPVFQPAGGSYTQDVNVTITTSTPGAIIRYTIDGSVPGAAAGNIYSGPIAVSNTTTIKAVAIKSGYSDSPVVSASYTLPLKAAAPVISPGEGTYTSAQSVTIVSSTAGAAIKYTIDGTNPSETNGTAYTGTFTISATTTIKAVAIMSGMTNSNITTASFVINTEKAATPVFSPAAGTYSTAQSVTLSTATAGASIKYTTDGSAPSATNGLTYSGAISVTSTTTIKAVAIKTGLADSDAASAAYTIQEAVSAPIFSPSAGSYDTAQSVSIVSATSGASVFFTTNGSTPTLLSSQYTSPVSITSSATIKAIAVKTGMAASSISSAAYTILQKVSAPSFNPATGSYEGTQSVAITSATSGTSIYYTLDGSTPSASSTAYTGAVLLASNITIKAIAIKTGMSNSDVSQASYSITFPPAADPVFSVASGTYNDTQSVTITSTTSGASIYYTLDNTNPTSASYLYTSAVSIGKTAFIKAIAVKSGMSNSNISIASYVIDRLAPSFTIQYYSDSALSLSLGDTPHLSAGTYYLKIISTKELRSAPTINIGAEGSANDVSGAVTAFVSEYTYKYTRAIASDAGAVGSVIEDISISATDIAGNAAASVNPSNESTKAAYTDTTAPAAAITFAPSSTVKQGEAITINAVISESLTSTPALKIAISGQNTLAATDMTRTDATHYTYSHTAGAGGGSATIALSGAKDLAGNAITAAPSSGASFTIDNTTLPAGIYKKVAAAPTTTVNDTYISGDTLTVGIANGPIYYYIATNATVKSIMGQLPNNNTFTIDSNGKVSAIDASIATGTPSIALTASQCAADLSVKGFADAALTLTGSAASQAINLNVTGGTVVTSDANLTGTVTMNTAAAATISTGTKAVTVGAAAAANAVGITATGGSVAINAAASAVSINGIKVDPGATTTITVTDANTLEAAGSDTTYTLDSTSAAAPKIFNFTSAQSGAINAISEAAQGLTIGASADSNANITITGGLINVSDNNLKGTITASAASSINAGSNALTASNTAGTVTIAGAGAITKTGAGALALNLSAGNAGAIIVTGSPAVSITNTSTNTSRTVGDITLDTGALTITAGSGTSHITIGQTLGATAGTVTIIGGAANLTIGNLATTGALAITAGAGTITTGTYTGNPSIAGGGTGVITLGSITGNVTITGHATAAINIGATTAANVNITTGAAAITVGNITGNAAVTDAAGGNGAVNFGSISGTLGLTSANNSPINAALGANAVTGITTISGSTAAGNKITLSGSGNSGALNITGGHADISAWTGSGSKNIAATAITTVAAGANAITVSAIVAGDNNISTTGALNISADISANTLKLNATPSAIAAAESAKIDVNGLSVTVGSVTAGKILTITNTGAAAALTVTAAAGTIKLDTLAPTGITVNGSAAIDSNALNTIISDVATAQTLSLSNGGAATTIQLKKTTGTGKVVVADGTKYSLITKDDGDTGNGASPTNANLQVTANAFTVAAAGNNDTAADTLTIDASAGNLTVNAATGTVKGIVNISGTIGGTAAIDAAGNVTVSASGDISGAISLPAAYAGTWTSTAKNLTTGTFTLNTTAKLVGTINLNAADNVITTTSVAYQKATAAYEDASITTQATGTNSTTSDIAANAITLGTIGATADTFTYGTSADLATTSANQRFKITASTAGIIIFP